MSLPGKINSKMTRKDFYLVDSATTHTILKDKKIFSKFKIMRNQCRYHIRFIELN